MLRSSVVSLLICQTLSERKSITWHSVVTLLKHLQAPKTIQARDTFIKDRMWTLWEWILACRGRLATDPRDLVFAGLSLVHPERLTIDSSLLKQDSGPIVSDSTPILTRKNCYPRSIPPQGMKVEDRSLSPQNRAFFNETKSLIPNGLWSTLQADYTVDIAEVLVNTAACFLTQSGTREVLSIAARTSDPSEYTYDWWIPTDDYQISEELPSWVPVYGLWTVCYLYNNFRPKR